MTWLFVTQRPSSLTATAPASFRSAISVSCSPFWPDGDGADGVQARAAERARLGDEHLGDDARVVDRARVRHAQTSTKPPAAAARRPLATSSLPSLPGLAQVRVQVDEARAAARRPARSTTRTRSLAARSFAGVPARRA